MALQVSIPQLSAEGATGVVFSESKPISIVCSSITFSDGTPIDPLQTTLFGYRLYRKQSSGAGQVWDSATQTWLNPTAQPQPQSLFFQEGIWQGLLIAIGQKDAAGAPMLATNPLTHFPRYSVRCLFAANDSAGVLHEGESGASADFEMLTMADSTRAGVGMQPDDPAETERFFLFLKDGGLSERGRIEIRRDGAGFRIDLTVAGATVTLAADGDIHLTPAAGQRVLLNGPVTMNGDLLVNGSGFATGGFIS
jgi:hypothetical protein